MAVQEGTNKAIVINSGILYARLLIVIVCGIFTTRFAMQALGVADYGLLSVLGGIVALVEVANAVMVNTTTRFMTVALGRGDEEEINQQFNINFRIHIATALLSLIVAFTVGYWYIYNYLNYEGDIQTAILVFTISVLGVDAIMIGVPYVGLITAKENFLVTSIPTILSAILKLVISWLLVYYFSNKLFVYAGAQFLLTAYPVLVYVLYCKRKYPKFIRFTKIKEKRMYKEVLTFSGWTLYGTAASMAKGQGAAIIINLFFTTVMNAALGVANSMVHLINSFAQNASTPMFPQITKSYAAGNITRCIQLLCLTTKLSYLIILLISSPFLLDAEWILSLWLVEVPPFAAKFTCLLLVDLLVSSFNAGVATVIKANGKIWAYELFGNTLRIVAVIVAYFIIKNGAPTESLFYVYIICSLLVVIINQFILHRVTHIDNRILIKNSYMPSILVTFLFMPYLYIDLGVIPLMYIIVGFVYLMLLVWFVGLNRTEKQYIKQRIYLLRKRKL